MSERYLRDIERLRRTFEDVLIFDIVESTVQHLTLFGRSADVLFKDATSEIVKLEIIDPKPVIKHYGFKKDYFND